MDDHERSRGFSPLPERSVGSYNETGHDEAWPSHTKAKRSGFHFTAGPIRTTSCFRCNGVQVLSEGEHCLARSKCAPLPG